ncbi:uncharacterized protein A4U43_C05F11480 [Asparagus officinalis]|uniref:Uncharacterized protein n=3 Tax=Asparagus officinalis TaxID=4686 RepID=A0A5P1ER71_ASPOF|nr:uncharacterized protein A4U43_C08F7330 [Asparagus officinalis]ONK68436.1 uncharacterized protein A4U43_C05F11480 [Asparagus officinalis]
METTSISAQPSLPSLPSLNNTHESPTQALYQCITTLRGHSSYISALAVDGNSLYSGSADRQIRIWTHTGHESRCTTITCESPIKSLLISKDTMFSSHQDHKIRVWHIYTKYTQPCRLQAVLPTAKDRILSLLSPGKHVQVRRHKKCTWVQHVDAVSALAFSDNRTILYSVSWDRSLKIWQLSSNKCIESVPRAHDDAISAVVISKLGFIYTGSADTTIRVWKMQEGQKKHKLVDTLQGHRSAVNALALSVEESILYSGSCDRSVVVWGGRDGHREATGALRGHTGAVLCLSVSGDLVCSGSADRTVRMWRRREDKGEHYCLGVLQGHGGPVKSLAMVTSDEDCGDECSSWLVYSGSLDCDIKVWKILVPSSERE